MGPLPWPGRPPDVGGLRVGVVDWVLADPAAGVPGVGSALRDAASEWFEEQGCHEQVARIEPVNTASQELHRRGGFTPLPVRSQLRRWGWRLPQLRLRAHAGFDPGLQLWVRTDPPSKPSVGSRWTGTVLLNVLLLALVVWRARRDLAPDVSGVTWMAAIVVLLLGAREVTLRLVARAGGLTLGHVPWVSGVGVALAFAAGVWLPPTGSSVPASPFLGRSARIVHDHSRYAWAALATGAGALGLWTVLGS